MNTIELAPEAAPTPAGQQRNHQRNQFRQFLCSKEFKLPEARPGFALSAPLTHGWLLRYLLPVESMCWGRWDYWCEMAESRVLHPDPIPGIEWEHAGSSAYKIGRKAIEHALQSITSHHWNSWGTWTFFEYFLDWLLFGLGHTGQKTLPVEPMGAEGACLRLYQTFNLGPLLLAPTDYFGDILAENAHGRHLGFYPTPMHVCQMMAMMTMGDGPDHRLETVCDPCVGTGRMLLAASNHSLCLYAMDINPIVIKACLVNGFFYAPWMVRPLSFLNRSSAQYNEPELAPAFSANLAKVADADPRAAQYTDWLFTEHDFENTAAVHPIKIRRAKRQASTEAPASIQPELVLA